MSCCSSPLLFAPCASRLHEVEARVSHIAILPVIGGNASGFCKNRTTATESPVRGCCAAAGGAAPGTGATAPGAGGLGVAGRAAGAGGPGRAVPRDHLGPRAAAARRRAHQRPLRPGAARAWAALAPRGRARVFAATFCHAHAFVARHWEAGAPAVSDAGLLPRACAHFWLLLSSPAAA